MGKIEKQNLFMEHTFPICFPPRAPTIFNFNY